MTDEELIAEQLSMIDRLIERGAWDKAINIKGLKRLRERVKENASEEGKKMWQAEKPLLERWLAGEGQIRTKIKWEKREIEGGTEYIITRNYYIDEEAKE
jgi:hypothetical protein